MNGINALLGTLVALFALVSLVAGSWAAMKQATIKTLRESNGDLRDQHKDDAERIATRELEKAELATKLIEAQAEVKLLKEINTQQVSWHSVTDLLGEHHAEAVGHWQADEETWREMNALMKRLVEHMEKP